MTMIFICGFSLLFWFTTLPSHRFPSWLNSGSIKSQEAELSPGKAAAAAAADSFPKSFEIIISSNVP